MEKEQFRFPEKSLPVAAAPKPAAVHRTHAGAAVSGGLRESAAGMKPGRDEVARCIRIWASVYRLRDD